MEPINTGRPEAVWRGAHPALWIAIFGGLIAFAWEMFQLPFYSTDGLGPVEAAARSPETMTDEQALCVPRVSCL